VVVGADFWRLGASKLCLGLLVIHLMIASLLGATLRRNNKN